MATALELYYGMKNDELAHYGTPGMHWRQQGPGKRYQSQAVYAQGRPNPDAKVRGQKKQDDKIASIAHKTIESIPKSQRSDAVLRTNKSSTKKKETASSKGVSNIKKVIDESIEYRRIASLGYSSSKELQRADTNLFCAHMLTAMTTLSTGSISALGAIGNIGISRRALDDYAYKLGLEIDKQQKEAEIVSKKTTLKNVVKRNLSAEEQKTFSDAWAKGDTKTMESLARKAYAADRRPNPNAKVRGPKEDSIRLPGMPSLRKRLTSDDLQREIDKKSTSELREAANRLNAEKDYKYAVIFFSI